MLSKSVPHDTQEWVRSFYSFLDEEFDMKAFTTEVWILPINTKPLFKGVSYWDIHRKYSVYFDANHPAVRPLYLAFRVDGQVEAIYRVSRIEPSIRITKVVPELNDLKEDWLKRPHTIWHYGPPVPLANPVRTGGGMYNRRVRCDLDLLLTCKTVKEIEVEMDKRRNQPDAIDEDCTEAVLSLNNVGRDVGDAQQQGSNDDGHGDVFVAQFFLDIESWRDPIEQQIAQQQQGDPDHAKNCRPHHP
jgi:hypothetical protein